MSNFVKIKKLDLESFELDLNIIFGIKFLQTEEGIKTEIDARVGLAGVIVSQSVSVKI